MNPFIWTHVNFGKGLIIQFIDSNVIVTSDNATDTVHLEYDKNDKQPMVRYQLSFLLRWKILDSTILYNRIDAKYLFKGNILSILISQ